MSKPKKRGILPVNCGLSAFGVNSDAVAKALCPKLSGVNPALVDLLYSIEWFKDRVRSADAVVKQKQAIPEHLRKVSQKIVPVLTGEVITTDKLSWDEFHPIGSSGDVDAIRKVIEASKLDGTFRPFPYGDGFAGGSGLSNADIDDLKDAKWPGPVHAMSSGARVIEVDELEDAIEARDIERQSLNLKMSEFNDLCEGALTRGESEVFLQIAEIVKALKERPLSFLVFQAWLLGDGKPKASEIRKQVNEWLKQDGREREIRHDEKTITNNLKMIGLPYQDGKNKKMPRNSLKDRKKPRN